MSIEERQLRNHQLIEDFRAHDGEVTTGQYAGRPLLLLTTTGARSGREHVAPLAYVRDGDRYVVVGSQGGRPTHPHWYHNLVAHPQVTVEVGSERFPARATVAEGAERDRLYRAMVAEMPRFAEHERKTTRVIPVIVLERQD